jgi:hypothetical protein
MQGVAVLRGLRVLRVAYNGLTSLEGLGRFTALETLDAGYNSIRELGTSLHSCVGLKELILGGWVLLKQSWEVNTSWHAWRALAGPVLVYHIGTVLQGSRCDCTAIYMPDFCHRVWPSDSGSESLGCDRS